MRDVRFYSVAAACAALVALVGGFAIAAAPGAQPHLAAPSTSSLTLSIHPGVGSAPPAYDTLHAMVRHGPVTITIVNHDTAAHGFDAPGLGVYMDIPAGATVTAAFSMPTPGIYEWYCWHPCPGDASPMAGAHGMSGDLVVV